jgi:hypothetical protein
MRRWLLDACFLFVRVLALHACEKLLAMHSLHRALWLRLARNRLANLERSHTYVPFAWNLHPTVLLVKFQRVVELDL